MIENQNHAEYLRDLFILISLNSIMQPAYSRQAGVGAQVH